MKIIRKDGSSILDVDFNNLKFGTTFSDHMFICKYKNGQWGEPEIRPYESINIMPGMQALHYGQSVFEGMKAFKSKEGKVLCFREEDNFNRLNKSAKRICIPEIPKDIFMNGLYELLDIDSDWVKYGNTYSLYIRPFIFASGQCIKATVSNEYTFMIITSPTTTYYEGEMHVLIDQEYTRASKGGTGSIKAAGNYAASFYPTQVARNNGFNQIIWTDAVDHKYLEEAGTMNIWLRIGDTLITPCLGDTILGGITRDSILQLARDIGIVVEERVVSVNELQKYYDRGELREAFGSGTAVSIIHFGSITKGDTRMDLTIPQDSYARKLKDKLQGIQYGRITDTHGWISVIDKVLDKLD